MSSCVSVSSFSGLAAVILTLFVDYYYWATAGGARIWWKKYLTGLQITQFVIDLFVVYFGSTYIPPNITNTSLLMITHIQLTLTLVPTITPAGLSLVIAPALKALRSSAVLSSRATSACSSTSTSKHTRHLKEKRLMALRTATGSYLSSSTLYINHADNSTYSKAH